MHRLYNSLLSCFILLLLNNVVVAQKDSINYDSLAALSLENILNMKVSGVSIYEEPINKAPASVIIITKEQICNNNYRDLSDILKNVIGIDVIDNARGYGELYTIRGITGNDRFLVLIDGQKINPASGTFLSIGNSISLNFAERVEIIFGPTSAIYGADAFSGIINIVTKTVKDKINISVNSDYGSLNTLNTEIVASFMMKNEVSFLFTASLLQSDGPNFIGRDSVYDNIKQYSLPFTNDFEQPINDHTLFFKTAYKNFSFNYFRQSFDEGNALGMKPQNYIYNRENKWASVNNVLWLNYEKEFKNKNIFTANILYNNFSINPETQFNKWKEAYEFSDSFSQYMTGIDNSIRASAVYNWFVFSNLMMLSGIDYEYTNSIPPYANDQVFGSSLKYEGENAEIINRELTINEQRIAGFAQIKYSPFKKLDVIMGGRIDYSLRNKETFNPRVSVIYNPFKKTVFKFLYGSAFQAPSLFYEYEQFGSTNAVMLSMSEIQQSIDGWKLKNQKVKTFEVIAHHNFNDSYNFHFSVYHSFLTNLIERNVFSDSIYNKYFSTETNPVYSNGIRNENIGNKQMYGVNLSTDMNLSKKIFTSLSYSYVGGSSIIDDVIEQVANISTHKIWLNMTYINVFKNVNISTRLKYIGKINNNNLVEFPSGKQYGFFNVDLNVNVRDIVKNTMFYVKINNVFNSKYLQSGILDSYVYLPTIPQHGFLMQIGLEVNLKRTK